jgi:uncharacterized protein YuzE
MPEGREVIGFEISLSARDDGTLEAAYIRFRHGKSRRTQEILEDTLLADYDARGNLLGLEVLAPVPLSELAKLVEQSRRASFRKFLKRAVPSESISAQFSLSPDVTLRRYRGGSACRSGQACQGSLGLQQATRGLVRGTGRDMVRGTRFGLLART